MHNGHVLRPQHLVHRLLLRLVQIGEAQWCEGELLTPDSCLLTPCIEQIPQIAQTTFGLDHAVERLKHRLVTRLVEE